jgi:hypothetical protein
MFSFKSLFTVFTICIALIVGYIFVLPPMKDQLLLDEFEKIAKYDKINHAIVWPEHVGIYFGGDPKSLTDDGANLLYGGHTKKITNHKYNWKGEIVESHSFWLENRDICPNFSIGDNFKFSGDFGHTARFHAHMGLCLVSAPSDHQLEPVQILSTVKQPFDNPEKWENLQEYMILNSPIALDFNPEPDVILAKQTIIRYKKTGRFTLLAILNGYPTLFLQEPENFMSSRLPAVSEHKSKLLSGSESRRTVTINYLANPSAMGQGPYLEYENRDYIKNPYDLIPTDEERLFIAASTLTNMSISDFPPSGRNAYIATLFDNMRFHRGRSEYGPTEYQQLVDDLLPAVTAELRFFEANFEITHKELTQGYYKSIDPFIVDLYRIFRDRPKLSLGHSDDSDAFKSALYQLVLRIDAQGSDSVFYGQEGHPKEPFTSIFTLAGKTMLDDGAFQKDVATAILNQLYLDPSSSSHNVISRNLTFHSLLSKYGDEFPEVIDRLIGDIEAGNLETSQVKLNFELLRYVPLRTLLPYKDRLLIEMEKHERSHSRKLRSKLAKSDD